MTSWPRRTKITCRNGCCGSRRLKSRLGGVPPTVRLRGRDERGDSQADMKLVVTDDYEAFSQAGADLVAQVIAAKPDAAVVLATGDTPMGLYRELAARHRAGVLDTSHL